MQKQSTDFRTLDYNDPLNMLVTMILIKNCQNINNGWCSQGYNDTSNNIQEKQTQLIQDPKPCFAA